MIYLFHNILIHLIRATIKIFAKTRIHSAILTFLLLTTIKKQPLITKYQIYFVTLYKQPYSTHIIHNSTSQKSLKTNNCYTSNLFKYASHKTFLYFKAASAGSGLCTIPRPTTATSAPLSSTTLSGELYL